MGLLRIAWDTYQRGESAYVMYVLDLFMSMYGLSVKPAVSSHAFTTRNLLSRASVSLAMSQSWLCTMLGWTKREVRLAVHKSYNLTATCLGRSWH